MPDAGSPCSSPLLMSIHSDLKSSNLILVWHPVNFQKFHTNWPIFPASFSFSDHPSRLQCLHLGMPRPCPWIVWRPPSFFAMRQIWIWSRYAMSPLWIVQIILPNISMVAFGAFLLGNSLSLLYMWRVFSAVCLGKASHFSSFLMPPANFQQLLQKRLYNLDIASLTVHRVQQTLCDGSKNTTICSWSRQTELSLDHDKYSSLENDDFSHPFLLWNSSNIPSRKCGLSKEGKVLLWLFLSRKCEQSHISWSKWSVKWVNNAGVISYFLPGWALTNDSFLCLKMLSLLCNKWEILRLSAPGAHSGAFALTTQWEGTPGSWIR